MSLVELSVSNGVARAVLNRPEKLNAMSAELIEELTAALEKTMGDDEVRVVVLNGAGRAFSAGADVRAEADDSSFRDRLANAPADMAHTRMRVEEWLRLKALPKPVIAQVHGYCLGLANELVGCCDLVVCAESAQFGMPEVRQHGLFPTLGFWPERIGAQRTFELITTGRLVDGPEAVEIGLAVQCVPDDDLETATGEMAARLAEIDPGRLVVTKAAVNSWVESSGRFEAARRGAQFHALYHQGGQQDQETS